MDTQLYITKQVKIRTKWVKNQIERDKELNSRFYPSTHNNNKLIFKKGSKKTQSNKFILSTGNSTKSNQFECLSEQCSIASTNLNNKLAILLLFLQAMPLCIRMMLQKLKRLNKLNNITQVSIKGAECSGCWLDHTVESFSTSNLLVIQQSIYNSNGSIPSKSIDFLGRND